MKNLAYIIPQYPNPKTNWYKQRLAPLLWIVYTETKNMLHIKGLFVSPQNVASRKS